MPEQDESMYNGASKILQILVDMLRDVRLMPVSGPAIALNVVFHSTSIISVILNYRDYSAEVLLGPPEWEMTPPTKLLREALKTLLGRLYERYPAASSEDCAQWESICELRVTA